jgi:hypothetical protein
VQVEDFRILLALEPAWTVSINGTEFLHLRSAEIEINGATLRFGRFTRRILGADYLRHNIIRVRARAKARSQPDVLLFYAGERLPSGAELRRRRTAFQSLLIPAVTEHFGARVVRSALHSDKQHGIGGAYPRLLVGSTQAVIAADPDDAFPIVNGVMRAAIQWSTLVKRRISVVVPAERSQTIVTRLRAIPTLIDSFDWLAWDGHELSRLSTDVGDGVQDRETRVYPYVQPDVGAEVERICSLAPNQLQAVPHIPGRAVSIRLRGLEVARVAEGETIYPLGEPLEPLIEELSRERRHGSRHPLARAHEEAWLESNLIGQIRDLMPVRRDFIYPQVPSFEGQERKIIDLLAITDEGRLVVIEIKATPDPDLPFQAFDYWLAVERHRKAGDFTANGYFRNINIRNEPAILVMVAPLLSFHRTLDRLLSVLPAGLPVVQIGINQAWKKEIKILRRKGAVG